MRKSVYSKEFKAVLSVLVKARQEAGLSQSELGAKIGKPQNFISYVERGERRLDLLDFIAYARALGRDPGDLISEVEKGLT